MIIRRRIQKSLVDLALIALGTILALALRENLVVEAYQFYQLLPYLACSLAAAITLNLLFGLDRLVWRYSVLTDYAKAAIAVCLVALIATSTMFLVNRLEGVSRSIPILQAMICVFLLVGARIATRVHFQRVMLKSAIEATPSAEAAMGGQNVLLVGVNRLALLLHEVAEHGGGSVRIAGMVDIDGNTAGLHLKNHRIFGRHQSLASAMRELSVHGVPVHRIILTVAPEQVPAALALELADVSQSGSILVEHVTEIFGLSRTGQRRAPARVLAGRTDVPNRAASPAQQPLQEEGQRRVFWRVKRTIDIVLAAGLLLALAPLFAVIAIVIGFSLGFPVHFWQIRPGYRGRTFKLFKFRTMSGGYDQDGRPLDDSQRLNAVGRLLRATRLDELPQLWNIFVGDMSFVGPRPLLPVDQVRGAETRFLVRPGLTGWAQVVGGRVVNADDKMALDDWYVRNASLKLDLEIMLRTIPVMIFGERVKLEAVRKARENQVRPMLQDITTDSSAKQLG